MKVIVKARHMKLTDALKAYAEEKLSFALSRVFDRDAAKIEIELRDLGHIRDKQNKECHVTLHMPRAKTIVINEVDDDMYKAINLAHDRFLETVKRERERQKHASERRKWAVKERGATARVNLTTQPEEWEDEVRQYENSLAGV
jgi:putative sigma-54 modulation protein